MSACPGIFTGNARRTQARASSVVAR